MITNDHIVGFAAGAAATALALYWYDQNRDRVNQFLEAQRLGVGQPGAYWPPAPQQPFQQPSGDQKPTLEELMAQKERLEDMIAELHAAQEGKAK
jgi:hypothetical protein